MSVEQLKGGAYRLSACAFLLFMLTFYVPISPKPVFYLGLVLPGLAWLAWRPLALPQFFIAFGWLLLPLAGLQLLNLQAAAEIKQWFYLVALLAGCVMVERSDWNMTRVYRVFAWFSVFVLLWVAADWLWTWQQSGEWIRYMLVFGRRMDPNNTALLISGGLVFLWLTQAEPWLERRPVWYKLLGLLALSAAVLLAATMFQSRSTLMGYGLFMAVYVLQRRMWRTGLAVVLGIVVLAYLLGVEHILSQRGFSYRPEIWADAWARLYTHCGALLGCGDDHYRFLGMFTHTHNLPLQILYNDGFVGLALITVFAWVYFRDGFRSQAPWFLLSMVGLGGLMTNTGWLLGPPKAFWAYFWLPVLLALVDMRRLQLAHYLAARASRPLAA